MCSGRLVRNVRWNAWCVGVCAVFSSAVFSSAAAKLCRSKLPFHCLFIVPRTDCKATDLTQGSAYRKNDARYFILCLEVSSGEVKLRLLVAHLEPHSHAYPMRAADLGMERWNDPLREIPRYKDQDVLQTLYALHSCLCVATLHVNRGLLVGRV